MDSVGANPLLTIFFDSFFSGLVFIVSFVLQAQIGCFGNLCLKLDVCNILYYC